jgi:hypothetical protein
MTRQGEHPHHLPDHLPLQIGEVDEDGRGKLTVDDVVQVARDRRPVAKLSPVVRAQMDASKEWVDQIIVSMRQYETDLKAYNEAALSGKRAKKPTKPAALYGFNTEFGALAGKASLDTVYETDALSRNLIVSHNTGVGEYFDEETVRAAMFLRANSLAFGYLSVRHELVEILIAMRNDCDARRRRRLPGGALEGLAGGKRRPSAAFTSGARRR